MSEKKVKQERVEETVEQKAEKAKRVEECQKQIQKVLVDNKCQFDVAVILKAGQVIPQINIVAN